jgi:hypothetical protein
VADDANPPTTPRLAFGQEDRDRYTLRRVLELGLTVAFECRSCRKISQVVVLDLVERHGLTITAASAFSAMRRGSRKPGK